MSPPADLQAEVDGVTKFTAHHTPGALTAEASRRAKPLLRWRAKLFARKLVGLLPDRYGGVGYGNVSVRLPSARDCPNPFLITGTGTGGWEVLDTSGLSLVERFDAAANTVWSAGPLPPSSESMTHGALYEASAEIGAIIHVHSRFLWDYAQYLDLPATAAEVAYGTPAMAEEMRRLTDGGQDLSAPVIIMTGHLDGVLAFGATLAEAGKALFEVDKRAERIARGGPI